MLESLFNKVTEQQVTIMETREKFKARALLSLLSRFYSFKVHTVNSRCKQYPPGVFLISFEQIVQFLQLLTLITLIPAGNKQMLKACWKIPGNISKGRLQNSIILFEGPSSSNCAFYG